jgi:hypothetical protein
MVLRYEDLIIGPDDHAGRPDPSDTADGTLFVCTEDEAIERSNGVDAWSEYYDLAEA